MANGKKNGAAKAAPDTEETANLPAVQEAGGAVALVGDEIPEWLRGSGPTGAENIDTRDVALPRIKLGQGTSDEVKAGLVAEGSFFLNVTKQALVQPGEPMEFVILATNKEMILWRDRNFDGGGVLARANKDASGNYAWDKPYEKFQNKIGGKVPVVWETKRFCGFDKVPATAEHDTLGAWGSEIPGEGGSGIAATAHHNYVVALPKQGIVAAFSLSRSQVKPATDLNGIIKLTRPGLKLWGRVFRATSIDAKNKAGQPYKNILFQPAGFVQDRALFDYYAEMASNFASKSFTVDQSDGGDSDTEAKSDGRF